MNYSKLIIEHSRRKPGRTTVRFEGSETVSGLGPCKTAGLFCEVWKLEGGLVVTDPLSRNPIRVFATPELLSAWLHSFNAPVEIAKS